MLGAIQKIGEPCQSQFNAGFLTHLYLIPTEKIVFVDAPNGSSVSQLDQAVGIQPGAVITEFSIKPKTAVFTETSSDTADGQAFSMQLAFPMKGTAIDVTNWIYQNRKRRFLVLTRDTLGNCYMIGNYENGVRVSWTRQLNALSMHQISLSLVNWHPLQFIPSLDLDALFPDQEFDHSFDISFS